MKAEAKLSILTKAVEEALKHLDYGNLDSPTFLDEIRNTLEQGLSMTIRAKPEKGGYDLVFNSEKIPTCQVLRKELTDYYNEFPGKYPIPLYTEFIRYWSEPNGKGIPRWYTEKTKARGRFYIPGRLATWAKNYKPQKEAAEVKQPTEIPDRLKMRVV